MSPTNAKRANPHYPSLPELTTSLSQAGFSDVTCYGILPITATRARQRAINTLRRWVLRAGILPWLGPLKTLLQQMSYGQLYPLPPTIDAQWVATWQANLSHIPLVPTQPDCVHRVIYVEGRV